MLVLVSAFSALLVTVKVDTVKAENASVLPPNPLDMLYIWNWTNILANIIYSFNGTQIPRGRAFGSHGADLAKNIILNEMTNNLSLVDPHPEKIKHILTKPGKYYTSIINVTDFKLTINNPNYPLPHDVPINESFVIPSAFIPMTRNTILNNTSIVAVNLTNTSLLGNIVNYSMMNISNYQLINNNSFFVGNVTFLSENATIPDQENQQGRIFVINNSAQSQSQLDNFTYASGCIVINLNSRYIYPLTAYRCPYAVMNVSQTSGNLIRNLTTNYTMVIADIEKGHLVFYYNITEGSLVHQNQNYIVIDRIPTHYEMRSIANQSHAGWIEYIQNFSKKNFAYWCLNFLPFYPNCKAFILFDTYDQHFMNPAFFIWNLEKPNLAISPAIPTYTINNTVGEFIIHNESTTTLSGHINQEFEAETPFSVGVTAYNVLGNITNPNNKNKQIAVLSSRLDGWFGQTTGDSGAGNAILLGLARYFTDNDIIPKYNLTILYTTGEEYGLRGAEYYNDKHSSDNIKFWFVLDEFAFNQSDTVQEISIQNKSGLHHWPILEALIQDSQYTNRTGYQNYNHSGPIFGTEQYIYGSRPAINDAICIAKDYYYEWDRYHSTGDNFTEGDALKYTDRNDLNVTAELALNISKYWLMNTDCHFLTKQYQAVSSTGGTTPDTLKATFKVKSALPNDKVMINASLYDFNTGLLVNHTMMNYTTNRAGIERNISFTMPTNVQEGDYYMTLEVYNSTARINRIADTHYQGNEQYHANDTDTSQTFHLNRYHTLGDIRIGTSTMDVHNNIRGSRFTIAEDAFVHNITAYVYGVGIPMYAPTYQCMIYRAGDGHLMGATAQVTRTETGWYTFSFNPRPILKNNTQYMLCVWGDNINALVYATPQTYANGYVNSSYTFGNPPPIIRWDDLLALKQYSIFCRYTLNLPPEIVNVSHTPDTVGFGYNVTITANVTDDKHNVTSMKVNITYPDHTYGNYTMDQISPNHYRYVFSDTWSVGQYNYTVWVVDNASNVNSSSGHHFHVYAKAQISIATLQDSYPREQYINLTDPPTPPANYTLVGRGLDWNKYYDVVTGQNILEVSAGPVNYQNETGEWTPINCTLQQLLSNHPAYAYGYRIGNDHGLYHVYFKPNAQSDWPVAFAYNKSTDPTTHVIRSKLVGVGYVDPGSNWAYQYLQGVEGSQGLINGNTVTYENVFPGTDVAWSYCNTEMKEEITMDNTTKALLQNHPPSTYGLKNESSYLVFITKLNYQDLNLCNTSGILTGNVTIPDSGIDFRGTRSEFSSAPCRLAKPMN